jgi:hypothetical protein
MKDFRRPSTRFGPGATSDQAAGGQGGASNSDWIEAMNIGDQGRLSGSGADVLVRYFGNPPWAVTPQNGTQYFNDTMKVVSHERGKGHDRPKWYQDAGPRSLGHLYRGIMFQAGGWVVLSPSTGAGFYHVGIVDDQTGESHYFVVEYKPARARNGTLDALRDENGGMTLKSGLYSFQRVAFKFINVFSPGQNLIEGVAGRKLDPYDKEFGRELTKQEADLELTKGIAKCLPFLSTMTRAQVIAWGVASAAEAGEAVVDELVANDVLGSSDGAYTKAVLKLAGLAPQLAKMRGTEVLDLSDYLGSLSALWGCGEEVIRGALGDKAYKEFWEANAKEISTVFKEGNKSAAIIEALAKAK